MALTNSQYTKIMRDYEEKQNETRLLQDARKNEVITKIPEYKILDDEAIDASMEYARMTLLNRVDDADKRLRDLKVQIGRIAEQKALLLQQNGYPANYLDPVYTCPDCKDTGYIGNEKCHCFKQQIVDLLYSQSNLNEVLKAENFSTFRLDYFSKNDIDPASKLTCYELMSMYLKNAKEFVANFSTSKENLLFTGNAGLGKTFLSHCIANELLKKGYTVLYLSAPQLFDILRKELISKNGDEKTSTELGRYVFNCDLLIIDDLGTENITEFTVSELNTVINERLLGKHSTIISTNLTPLEMKETYGERNFSRVVGLYTLYKFYGKDIRLAKKYSAL